MASRVHALARLPEEWARVLEAHGERAFRGRQIFRWIHARRVLDPQMMTDLAKPLREWLQQEELALPARVVDVRRAGDGTRKLVLELSDGARVECVLIPMTSESDEDTGDDDVQPDPGAPQRVTLCVSTQYGCAMACSFCASGRRGLVRGLASEEVVAQLMLARDYLEPGEVLQNIVFMGMGEPLQHYDRTARVLRLWSHELGTDLSLRRITVSTVGLVPGIRRLGEDFGGKVGLAISLHAPDDATRGRIVPINRQYPVQALMEALRAYPLPTRRRITIEYTLIRGINDSPTQARDLVRLLAGLRVKINLIPMNPVAGSEHVGASPEGVEAFREVLAAAGLSCFVRTRRGDDVAAACGQLALHGATAQNGRSALLPSQRIS